MSFECEFGSLLVVQVLPDVEGSLFGIGGILEIVGGVMIVLGLFPRPVAFVLSGMMAVLNIRGRSYRLRDLEASLKN